MAVMLLNTNKPTCPFSETTHAPFPHLSRRGPRPPRAIYSEVFEGQLPRHDLRLYCRAPEKGRTASVPPSSACASSSEEQAGEENRSVPPEKNKADSRIVRICVHMENRLANERWLLPAT